MEDEQCLKEIDLIRKEIYRIIDKHEDAEEKRTNAKNYIEDFIQGNMDRIRDKAISRQLTYRRMVWIKAYKTINNILLLNNNLSEVLSAK